MRFKRLMAYAADFTFLGINIPLLVVGLVILFGGLYGLAKVSQTAALLVGLLGVVVVLLIFSEAVKSLRRDDSSNTDPPDRPS